MGAMQADREGLIPSSRRSPGPIAADSYREASYCRKLLTPSATDNDGGYGSGVRRDDNVVQSTISATALPQATVSALPPRSRVRSVRSPSVRSIAATIDAAAAFSPR